MGGVVKNKNHPKQFILLSPSKLKEVQNLPSKRDLVCNITLPHSSNCKIVKIAFHNCSEQFSDQTLQIIVLSLVIVASN
jgi:hypothetical protein